MSGLYEVVPDQYWTNSSGLEARHKWGLPGVKCSVCGETWAQTGQAYPSVDLSDLAGEELYRQLWPVPLERLKEMIRPLRALVPDGTVLSPGTEFGPLVGHVNSGFADFDWLNPWTLLVRSEVLAKLDETHVRLPRCSPTLLTNTRTDEELLEFELEPRTELDSSVFPSGLEVSCTSCGRVPATMPCTIVIQKSSVPNDVDIFRDRLFTTLILATDRFVEAVKRLGLRGLEFRAVDVS